MKTVAVDKTDLDSCVADAQSDRVVLTRNGSPVALVVGVAGLDREQIELGGSAKFWKLIDGRRSEKTISRAALENSIKRKTAKRRGK
jgi:antitoxin (DNA-binding transcriptional repressor) of toxin-antitoxin stability system